MAEDSFHAKPYYGMPSLIYYATFSIGIAVIPGATPRGVRRIQGVLSLAKRYGSAATEDACGAALEMGVREYRFVRRYLERTPQLSLRQVDPLIRELVHYRDLIQQKTQEPTS